MMEKPSIVPSRVLLTEEEKNSISENSFLEKWRAQEKYINYLEEKAGQNSNEKLKLQQQEAARRENVLVMRLATKEQEMQELLSQIQGLKEEQAPSTSQLQKMLIDPAVNLLFEKMKTELTETKDRLDQAQNDLSAWKFTPDSVTGKKLMAKCRMLIQENQDLGKQLSQGRIAQLEAELALQRKYSEELKGSQDEMNDFVIQLDEEVEGMQATICALQEELKTTKTISQSLEGENKLLRKQLEDNNIKTTHHKGINGVLDEEEETVDKTSNIKQEEDNERIKEEPTIEQFSENKNEFDDERTLHSNGDSNLTDESEELPMETDQPSITLTHQHKSDSLRTEEVDNDHLIRPNHMTVIRGTEENHISPTKGIAKTSFSITDLLASSGTENVKAENDITMEIGPENGSTTTPAINGDVDDEAI